MGDWERGRGWEGGCEEGAWCCRTCAVVLRGMQVAQQIPCHSSCPADGRYLAVWRCLLFPDHALRGATASALADTAGQLANLRSLVTAPSPHWVIVMLRGGHFAAAVLKARTGTAAGARTLGAAAATGAAAGGAAAGRHAGQDDMPFEVVAHKTFHRYVVRCVPCSGARGARSGPGSGTGKEGWCVWGQVWGMSQGSGCRACSRRDLSALLTL